MDITNEDSGAMLRIPQEILAIILKYYAQTILTEDDKLWGKHREFTMDILSPYEDILKKHYGGSLYIMSYAWPLLKLYEYLSPYSSVIYNSDLTKILINTVQYLDKNNIIVTSDIRHSQRVLFEYVFMVSYGIHEKVSKYEIFDKFNDFYGGLVKYLYKYNDLKDKSYICMDNMIANSMAMYDIEFIKYVMAKQKYTKADILYEGPDSKLRLWKRRCIICIAVMKKRITLAQYLISHFKITKDELQGKISGNHDPVNPCIEFDQWIIEYYGITYEEAQKLKIITFNGRPTSEMYPEV